MTSPMFFVTRTDSGIDLPDLSVTDEKFLSKYGSDLTANFADIRAHGSKAFFQKLNQSTGETYSLSTCATGYIWVSVSPYLGPPDFEGFCELEIQVGTFALKARAISTVEVPCRYRGWASTNFQDGQLALLCSTVLARYLRLRLMGQQYEEATETAIRESRLEFYNPLAPVDDPIPGSFEDLNAVLRNMCMSAPMPPESTVSQISRSMITRRWMVWRESSVLRKRYFFPQRVIRCFKRSRHDSIDLLSGCFIALTPRKSRPPFLRT